MTLFPTRRIGFLVTALLAGTTLAGCASGGGTVTPTGSATTRALPTGASGGSRSGVGLEVTAQAQGQATSIAADPDAVYSALVTTYDALKIPLSRQDASARVLGNDGLKMRRQLGKIELRRALDCGGTAGMPNSETYQITASIITSVAADGANASTVTTVVDASGENPSFPGSGVRCSSAGSIEDAIIKDLRTRLNARQ